MASISLLVIYVVKKLNAIHAQESKKAAREKAKAVIDELRLMKLKEAAKKVEVCIDETLTYCDFPSAHWTRIRTNMEILTCCQISIYFLRERSQTLLN